jgi:hypothetical protein
MGGVQSTVTVTVVGSWAFKPPNCAETRTVILRLSFSAPVIGSGPVIHVVHFFPETGLVGLAERNTPEKPKRTAISVMASGWSSLVPSSGKSTSVVSFEQAAVPLTVMVAPRTLPLHPSESGEYLPRMQRHEKPRLSQIVPLFQNSAIMI